jgi:hypothetical protein
MQGVSFRAAGRECRTRVDMTGRCYDFHYYVIVGIRSVLRHEG